MMDVCKIPNDYVPTNREKSRRAKLGKWWCKGCDRSIIGETGRCPSCGVYANRKKRIDRKLD